MVKISDCPLFADLTEAELSRTLTCLAAQEKVCKKGEYLLRAEEPAGQLGLVLSGAVRVIEEDYWGSRNIIARVTAGELFGEAFALAGVESFSASVICQEKGSVLLFDWRRLNECPHRVRLLENFSRICARKNLYLTRKMAVLAGHTIRGKLMLYFSHLAAEQGTSAVTLPFGRQELADYLLVDRSALCRELSNMERDQILRRTGRCIELL